MKILDWYILKRYLFTFLMMLLLFIPIAIMVHLAEKIGKIISNDVPLDELAMYLLNFTIYFANFEVKNITDKNKNNGKSKLAK